MNREKSIFLSTALLATGLIAHEGVNDLSELTQQTTPTTVSYKITIYRDPSDYNETQWNAIIDSVGRAINKGKEEATPPAHDMIEALLRGIEMMYQLDGQSNAGIHGEMVITMGEADSNQSLGCPCIKKYNGKCPCMTEKK